MGLLQKLIVLFFLLSMQFCKEKEIASAESIQIFISDSTGCAPIYIAFEKGFFQANGLDVKLKRLPDSEILINRSIDLICAEFSDTIMYNSEIKPVKIIYRLNYNSRNDLFIASKEITKFTNLKGKTIGFDGVNSSSHLFIRQVLKKNGLLDGEYFVKNLTSSESIKKILSKEIQAGHVKLKDFQKEDESHFQILSSSGDVPDYLTHVVSIDSQYLKKNQQLHGKILNSIEQGVEFCKTNPEALQMLSEKWNKEKTQLERELSAFYFLTKKENLGSLRNEKNIPKTDKINENISFDSLQKNKQGTLFQTGNAILEFFSTHGQFFIKPDLEEIILGTSP